MVNARSEPMAGRVDDTLNRWKGSQSPFCGLNRVEKASLFQKPHAAGQHAFADYKAWENLFFDDEQAKTFALQLRGREGAGGARSDDDHVVIRCAWVVHQR